MQDRLLERLQPVQARREERVDGGRHLGRHLVGEHRDHLLEEEGVALCGVGDARARVCGHVELVEERRGLFVGQRLDRDECPGPARADVVELGAGEAQQQDGRVARPSEHVLEQVEERRLRPVHVLDTDDERPQLSARLQPLPHVPEDLVVRAAGDLAEELLQRQERDAVPVRHAARGQHVRGRALQELLGEP